MTATKKLTVSNIMTKAVVVANKQSKFSQLMEFFTVHKIQHLPVTEGDQLVGIISLRDMTKYISQKLKEGKAFNLASIEANFDINEVITLNPTTVGPDDRFEDVIKILSAGKFQAVPVVKDEMLHGIVTNKDVVKVYNWSLSYN